MQPEPTPLPRAPGRVRAAVSTRGMLGMSVGPCVIAPQSSHTRTSVNFPGIRGGRTDLGRRRASAGGGVAVSVAGKAEAHTPRCRVQSARRFPPRTPGSRVPPPAPAARRARGSRRVPGRGRGECAHWRAGGAVVLKTEKRLYTTTGVGTEPQRSDAGRDTRADGADPRGGGGRYYIPYIHRPGSSRSRGTLLCVAHDGIAARKACSDDGERARRTEVCRNARKVQPQAARQLTLVFGPDTISQAAWRWAVGHGLARLGDPPSVRAANELPATAPSRACMRLSSRVRCRLVAGCVRAHGPRSPIISPRSPSIAPRSPIIAPRSPSIAPRSPITAPRSPIIAPRSPIIAPRSPRVRHDAPPEWPVASP